MQPYHKIISEIKNGKIHPFYLLSGLEPYFIDEISNFITRELVNESGKDFDFTVLYGKDSNQNEIVETAKRYPLISTYNVILVREAQYLEKKYDQLINYLLSPQKSSVVIFCYKNNSFDKRNKLYKSAVKSGVVFDSKKLYENQMIEWLKIELGKNNLKATPKSIQLMIEFLGLDLGKMSQEINKLKVFSTNKLITPEIVEEHIGISKDYNNFELINAIGSKNKTKALKIIFYFSNDTKNNPITLTLSSVFQFFKKLLLYHGCAGRKVDIPRTLGISPYFLKDYENASRLFNMKNCSKAIEVIHLADLKSKGVLGDNELQKEILIDLINDLF